MSHTRIVRRVLAPMLITGGVAATLAIGISPAGATSRPGITFHTYQLTPTESWNACGGSDAVIRYDDGITLNCGTGIASWYTVN